MWSICHFRCPSSCSPILLERQCPLHVEASPPGPTWIPTSHTIVHFGGAPSSLSLGIDTQCWNIPVQGLLCHPAHLIQNHPFLSLVDAKCHLIVVLIWFSVIAYEIEHLFLWLFTIGIFFHEMLVLPFVRYVLKTVLSIHLCFIFFVF